MVRTNADGGARVSVEALDAIGSASAVVTTAGTSIALADHECGSVVVQAQADNTGSIYIGGASVDDTNGIPLPPGGSITLDVNNTSDVHLDADTSGDSVRYLWVV